MCGCREGGTLGEGNSAKKGVQHTQVSTVLDATPRGAQGGRGIELPLQSGVPSAVSGR